jgi:hypothetical protein
LEHHRHPSLSYVDLDDADVALMEILSEPDLRAPRRRAMPALYCGCRRTNWCGEFAYLMAKDVRHALLT